MKKMISLINTMMLKNGTIKTIIKLQQTVLTMLSFII